MPGIDTKTSESLPHYHLYTLKIAGEEREARVHRDETTGDIVVEMLDEGPLTNHAALQDLKSQFEADETSERVDLYTDDTLPTLFHDEIVSAYALDDDEGDTVPNTGN